MAEGQAQTSIVIVGAGECGGRAAFALRENGHEGSITLIGAEAIAPYERPPLSKAALLADAAPTFVAPAERYGEKNIDLLTGVSVTEISPAAKYVLLSDGRTLVYDKLLLATGAKPRQLPGMKPDSSKVLTLRSFGDAMAIRSRLGAGKHLAIIGGGFIGLELAATARRAGADVTLVETQSRVLTRGVPEEISRLISERHRSEGVALHCGIAITSVVETEDGVEILLADGVRVKADFAIVGIGAVANTALAEQAGLAIENGIAVNQQLETSALDIYAAGDCCSFPLALYGDRRIRLEAWRNAQDQGNLAARNMVGHQEAITSVPWFWSDQYDLTLQVAGLADGGSQTVRRTLSEDAIILFHLDDGGRLIAASGIARGNAIAKDMRVAEMMISARRCPKPADLADPGQKLKAMLSA